ERLAVSLERVGNFLVRFQSRVERAELESNLKGRGGLATEDVENLVLREWLWHARPAKLRALPATELPLAFGRHADHRRFLFRASFARSNQTVTFANEQVANVQRHGNAMFFVKCLLAI